MQTPLKPSVAASHLFPANAAFMARTDLARTRLMGFAPLALDTVTTVFMGLLNGRATVRHRAGASDEILTLFEQAGIEVAERMRVFDTADQAERCADLLIADNQRLFWPYPLREGRFADADNIVSPQVWAELNAKDRLSELVPAPYLAQRRVMPLDQLCEIGFEAPVYVKAGGLAPVGAGYAVRHCTNEVELRAAADWFAAQGGIDTVIVEAALEIEHCWCANIAISDEGVIFLGAAEQVFSAPGRQSGSIIDPENAFPERGRTLVLLIGEAARKRGFRGVAALDTGLTSDGRLIVFDPNFRINACSAQVLWHASAAERAGLHTSASVQVSTPASFQAAATALEAPIAEGWFIPTRVFDAAAHPLCDGKSIFTGMVLGHDRRDAFARKAQIESLLAA